MTVKIRCAHDVLNIPQIQDISTAEQEHQYVLGLDKMLRLVVVHLVAVGTVDQVQCHARDIFRELIRHNCTSFVLVHNHPGGDGPSHEDEEVTAWVRHAGEWLGIPLTAHIVVTGNAAHEVPPTTETEGPPMKTELSQEISSLIDGSQSMQPSAEFKVTSTKEEWNHIHLRIKDGRSAHAWFRPDDERGLISSRTADCTLPDVEPKRAALLIAEALGSLLAQQSPAPLETSGIARFRKRPVVIEAYQTVETMQIETLEGTMTANPGDWIITGIAGEKYPCKPDIFAASYEPVS